MSFFRVGHWTIDTSQWVADRKQLRSLPFLDDELWLRLRGSIADLKLDILGAHTLLEAHRRSAAIIARVRPLTGKQRDELVLTCFEVADEDSMHAARSEEHPSELQS